MDKLRVVIQVQDVCDAAHVSGAKPVITMHTFDVESQEVIDFIKAQNGDFRSATIIGAALVVVPREGGEQT